MGALIFIIVAVILLLCVLSGNAEHEKYEAKKRDEEKKALEAKYDELRVAEINRVGQIVGFQFSKGCSYKYFAKDGKHEKVTIFFVDDCNKRFMVGVGECGSDKTTGEPVIDWICPLRCFNYNQLLDFFIVDNGSQYIAGDPSGAMGGAMVGSMFDGKNSSAVGAVIGAAAVDRNIESECHELALLLRINDLQTPLIKLYFLEQVWNRNSEGYKKSRGWVDNAAAVLTYVKHNASSPAMPLESVVLSTKPIVKVGELLMSQLPNRVKKHYILTLKNWLDSRNKRYQGFQTKLIDLRRSGHSFTTAEHIRGVIYSLLSSQSVWAHIEPHLKEVDELFYNYDPAIILRTSQDYFYQGLVRIKCNGRFRKRQMAALHQIVRGMLAIEKRYKSLDNFVLSSTPDVIAGRLGTAGSMFKIPQMGETLAYEYLKNVGIDCCKPDVHITEFFGSDRMGVNTHAPATISEAVKCVESVSRETGLSKYEVDNIIWSFCAEGYGQICTANPNCSICPIWEHCKRGRSVEHDVQPEPNVDVRQPRKDTGQGVRKWIVLDTETTGLSDKDEILQLSIIDFCGDTVMDTYCRPLNHSYWPFAEQIHGITLNMVWNAQSIVDMADQIRDILENAEVIIGYNIGFDIRMIKNNFHANGLDINITAKLVDVMKEYKCRFGKPYKLTDCASHFGYTFKAHDSLEDCRATLYCFGCLFGGKIEELSQLGQTLLDYRE